jgi:uncharacterized protein (DUF983 family)
MDINWVLLVVAAGAIVGTMEWAKFWWKKGPSWLWHALLLPLSIAFALLTPGPIGTRVISAGFLLLAVQVGYTVIVRGVGAWVQRAAAAIGK